MKQRLTVVVPAEPIVTPADIAGTHAADDADVTALIAAAQDEIDGPNGMLGRSLGVQTLELALTCWPCGWFRLPCEPVIEIESVSYLDGNDASQAVAIDDYGFAQGYFYLKGSFRPSVSTSPYPILIRYTAGYDGTDVADGGTGAVPERARQAIILSVQKNIQLMAENPFVRSEQVEGVGTKQYAITEQASTAIDATAMRLLSGLRVPYL
jgi:hypothetical protein